MSMKKRNKRGIITERKIRITRGRLQNIIEEALDSWPLVGDDEGPMLDHLDDLEYSRKVGEGGKAKMARGQLFNTAKRAQSLHALLQDEDELPMWVNAKIASTTDRLRSVYDYVIYRLWQIKNEQ